MQLQPPSWAAYAVVPFANPDVVGWCSTVEKVVECMREHRIVRNCQVIRVQGDVIVWPIHSKGGTA